MWDRVMSNLMTVVPFLGSATEPPLSRRRSCWAYADMLEVGRMLEHNAAESRSHISAWAIVSSPVSLRSSSTLYAVRNVWEGRDEPAPLSAVSALIPPHDCALYILSAPTGQ
jgi:hypothetical protein